MLYHIGLHVPLAHTKGWWCGQSRGLPSTDTNSCNLLRIFRRKTKLDCSYLDLEKHIAFTLERKSQNQSRDALVPSKEKSAEF